MQGEVLRDGNSLQWDHTDNGLCLAKVPLQILAGTPIVGWHLHGLVDATWTAFISLGAPQITEMNAPHCDSEEAKP